MADPYLTAIANGIDPSWLGGSAAPAAPSLPPMTSVVPGKPLFGGPSGAPTMPAQPPVHPAPVINMPPVDMSDPAPAGPPVPPPPAAAPPPERNPFPLRMASAGGAVNIPAHETEMRGPSLLRAQDSRNDTARAAIEAVAERSQRTAEGDLAIALERERQAQIQADAAEYSMAERAQEMEQRQADWDMGVKAMAKQASDPKNFYSEPNVGQKFAALISAGLAGFVAGKTGRPGNVGLDVIKGWNEKEARAQEMAFQLTRDTQQAKQTAFSMAMQKHNNLDAARAMTRAALAEASQAQVAQQAALWKSTEAQNHAQLLLAALEDEKMMQIAKGVAFTPAQTAQVGRTFVDEDGITYNEAQARELQKERRGQAHDINKIDRSTAGDVLKEGAKAEAAAQKDERGKMVQLPNGDVVKAPSDAEAGKLREASVALHNINRIVKQAREIRSDPTWMADPRAGARLKQLQSEATIAAKEIGNLGVLAGPDLDLTNKMVGDMTSVMPGVDKQLGAFADSASAAVRNRVKTYPDAPATAKGAMPASFTPHGKK